MAFYPPWESSTWAPSSWVSTSWDIPSPNTGVVWQENSWAAPSWAEGTWVESWVETGYFSLTGMPVSLKVNHILVAGAGTFALNGQDVQFLRNRIFEAGVGSYTISGQSVTFVVDNYLLNNVNTNNEVVDSSTSVVMNGQNLDTTTTVVMEYAAGGALKAASWVPSAWESGVWGEGGTVLGSTPLTNVVAAEAVVTADMFDVVTSDIPFTDINHDKQRIKVSDGVRESYVTVDLLPAAGYIVGTVQPADANTIAGQSIFGGLTLTPNMQVLLPVSIGGGTATWETLNGNITGRVELSATLSDPVDLEIPLWDDTLGWDVIEVSVVDLSDINKTLPVEHGVFSINGQDVGSLRNRVLGAEYGTYSLAGQNAGLVIGYSLDTQDIALTTNLQATSIFQELSIVSVLGLTYDQIQPGGRARILGGKLGNDADSVEFVLTDSTNRVVCTKLTFAPNVADIGIPTSAAALSGLITLHVGQFEKVAGVIQYDEFNNPIPLVGGLGSDSRSGIQVINYIVSNSYIVSTVDESPLTQHHLLAGNNLTISTSLDATTVSTNYVNLVVSNTTLSSSLSSPTLVQHHLLSPNTLSISSSLTASAVVPGVIPIFPIASYIITRLGVPTLVQHYSLSNNNMTVNVGINSPVLRQRNILTRANLGIGSSLTSPTLTQIRKVTGNTLNLTSSLTSPVNVQHHVLAPNNLTINSSLSTIATWPLSVNKLSVSMTIDGVSLTQHHILVDNNLNITTRLNSPSFVRGYSLTPNNLRITTRLAATVVGEDLEAVAISNIKVYPAVNGDIFLQT